MLRKIANQNPIYEGMANRGIQQCKLYSEARTKEKPSAPRSNDYLMKAIKAKMYEVEAKVAHVKKHGLSREPLIAEIEQLKKTCFQDLIEHQKSQAAASTAVPEMTRLRAGVEANCRKNLEKLGLLEELESLTLTELVSAFVDELEDMEFTDGSNLELLYNSNEDLEMKIKAADGDEQKIKRILQESNNELIRRSNPVNSFVKISPAEDRNAVLKILVRDHLPRLKSIFREDSFENSKRWLALGEAIPDIDFQVDRDGLGLFLVPELIHHLSGAWDLLKKDTDVYMCLELLSTAVIHIGAVKKWDLLRGKTFDRFMGPMSRYVLGDRVTKETIHPVKIIVLAFSAAHRGPTKALRKLARKTLSFADKFNAYNGGEAEVRMWHKNLTAVVESSSPNPKGGDATEGYFKILSRSTTLSLGCKICGKGELSRTRRLMLCSKCKLVRYCSRECQKQDWRSHRKECKRWRE